MEETECPWFTETVLYEVDGEYMIAQGWTQSTGQVGRFKYNPPEGWEFDKRYTDIRGAIGSHGGCHDCLMTLVHLISIDTIYVPPPEDTTPKEPTYDDTPYENLDVCGDVVCEDKCFDVDRYTTICVDGECVQGKLLRANDPECGYISPTPEDPNIFGVIIDNKEIIALGAIAGILFLKYA